MTKPKPVKIKVCSACGEDWAAHKEGKLRGYLLAEDERVTRRDCIRVLKNKNRGPIGHSGPPGPAGAMGPKGDPFSIVLPNIQKTVTTPETYYRVPNGSVYDVNSTGDNPSD